MTDIVDEAMKAIAITEAMAVARIRQALAGEGPEHCEICGERIEEGRRRALPAVRTCITCQETAEHRARR